MKSLILVVMLCTTFTLAQDAAAPDNSKHDKNSVTVQGCVSRETGDYILIKRDPGMTYELQATGKIRLHNYLGKRVEITGRTSPSLSTSSDAMARSGSPSSVTLSVNSIKILNNECTEP